MTATATQLQFMYVIASGWNDGVYKIGISQHPKTRLDQIKRDYDVPHAYIVETMDVPSREEVFAVENALHERFDAQRAEHYKGREWFELSTSDLNELKTMYKAESNAFAQCTAYYGLLQARDSIALIADEMEMERQSQIRYNRVNGLTYDTKPQGALKRYNELQKKIRTSTLGERFATRTYKHPTLGLCKHISDCVGSIVEKKLEGLWWKLGLGGLLTSAVITGSVAPDNYGPAVLLTVLPGAISGVVTSGARKETEDKLIEADAREWVGTKYGRGIMNRTMITIWDKQDERGFLLRDYNESSQQLREQSPRIPSIPSVVPTHLETKYRNKSYFPVLGVVATGIAMALTGIAAEVEQYETSYTPRPPIVRIN
jgi:hypothetical protein